jgi:hypothetical protein
MKGPHFVCRCILATQPEYSCENMEEDARCRLLLGLQEVHSEEQLRQAYHDMVKVWHPDRFAHDDRLRRIAQDKLKEINGAYEFLRAKLFADSITPQTDANSDPGAQAVEEPARGSRGVVLWTLGGMLGVALLAAGVFFFVKTNSANARTPVKQTQPATDNSKWEVLFDGKSIEHWRGFKREGFPDRSWDVRDGVLQSVEGAELVDLITRDEYQDFDLELEWRISPGGNSGIMFHVSEDAAKPWFSGPEMQILDDDQHPDGRNPKTSAGSLFDLIAPVNKQLKLVGEWNLARITVSGHHVEYWLNGGKVVEYELGSDALKALIAESQFRDQPGYARQKTGRIVLQSYERKVSFRNIKIRRLASPRAQEEP